MFARYQIFDYHHSSILNPKLYDVLQNCYSTDVYRNIGGGANCLNHNLHTRDINEVDILINWINQLIPTVAINFAGEGKGGGPAGFDKYQFKVDECWALLYSEGDRVIKHNHFPYSISFCYYVNSPEGSSPFVIEGEKINLKAGQIIFFLPHQYHWVVPTKYFGRCVVVGNILYTP